MPSGIQMKKSPKTDNWEISVLFLQKKQMPDFYPESFEVKTGFDKIRIMLKNRCLSTLGEELTDNIRFLSDFGLIAALLG